MYTQNIISYKLISITLHHYHAYIIKNCYDSACDKSRKMIEYIEKYFDIIKFRFLSNFIKTFIGTK